jgi:hypothetical protein
MKLTAASLVLLVATFGPPAPSSSESVCSAAAKAIPLCRVLADAPRYDGKDVTVNGLYYRVIHGSILTAPECRATKVNMRSAADWRGEKRVVDVLNSLTRRNQPADVVLRGTFRAAHDGCFGQTCSLFEIEEHELLCAKETGPVGPK